MPEIRELDQPDMPEMALPAAPLGFEGASAPQAVMMTPEDAHYASVDPEELKKFNGVVTEWLDQVRRYAKQGRDRRDFDDKRTRRRDRAQVKVQIEFNDDLSVANTRDAHAKLGVNQGWTHQANVTARKEIFFKLFRSAPRFYVIQGWGRKDENEKLEAILEKVAEHLLRRGGFYSTVAPILCQMLPIDGTVCVRFDYSYPHAMTRQPSGAFRESMAGEQAIPGTEQQALFDRYKSLMPQFQVWKLEDVLVTDWDLPTVAQQEGIFFMTPQTTVNRLSREEAVYVWEAEEAQTGMIPPVRRKYGRFVNMRQLREAQAKHRATPIQSNGTQYQTGSSRVSSFPPFTLVEFEGQMPMGKWAMDGILTPALAQYFEIDVGFMPMEGDQASIAEWARRLDGIRYYEVAYTGVYDADSGIPTNSAMAGERVLLELRPCPYRDGRTSLYKFHYLPDRDEFLGAAICDLGWRLENLGDLSMNAQGWVHIHNGNPSGVYFKDFLSNPTAETALGLLNPGKWEEVTRQGAAVPDIVKPNKLEIDPRAEEYRQSVKFEFENTTGIPAVTKGASETNSTGTATEHQMTAQKSEGLLDMISYDASLALASMVKEMLTLAIEILGEDEFKNLCVQACGKIAADIDHVMNEIMNGEFDVVSALANTEDPAVQATMLQRLYQLTAPTGEWNNRGFIEINGKLLRLPDIETCLAHGAAPMSPVSEHEQMAEGNTVRVHPQDDDMVHLQEHQNMQIALTPDLFGQTEAGKYFTPEQIVEIQKQLPSHIMQHQMAFQQKVAMGMGQPGQEGGGQEGQPKNPRMDSPGEAGAQGAPLEMDTQAAGMAGMRQNINQRSIGH